MNPEPQPVVCVVDDDASVRRALSRLLRSVGLAYRTFASATEFLAAEPPDRPACLVLDVRMPGLSGLDLQEELNRTVQREIPIVFITGHGDVPMSVRAMKSGALDFLPKPFDDQDLLDAVHGALEKDRQDQAAQAQVMSSTGTSGASRPGSGRSSPWW